MSIKFYAKKGKRNYKEVKLIKELEPIIDAKIKQNPELAENFRPVTTFEELQALHRQYLSQDVDFEEIENTDKKSNMNTENEELEMNDGDDFFEQIEKDSSNADFIDPFNREEPIVRDYVQGGGLKDDSIPDSPTRTHFDEPLTFKDAFELPSDDDNDIDSETTSEPRQTKEREPKKKYEKPDPLNPSFDEMSGAKKKKSTKKFAKYIVEAVCALSEKGFVWFANKEINEAKLNEYELNGEMDLSVLVTLETGQEATVKQFFIQQCYLAEELAKFEDEEKQDMADALTEVFMEKGIAPTPTQEALIVIGGVFVKKGAMLLSLKAQTNSLLNQLRMNNQSQSNYKEPSYQQPNPQPNNEPQVPIEEPASFDFSSIDDLGEEPTLEVDDVIQTKE